MCIFFMVKDFEHFFMYLLAISIYSFEICLFSSFAHVFIVLFILCRINFLSLLYILVINPWSDEELAKIFSHSVGCLFSLVTVSFAMQKIFSLMQSLLSILIAELLKFYSGSYCLCLYDPVYSLFFPVVAS
jgi:hypothetical protein